MNHSETNSPAIAREIALASGTAKGFVCVDSLLGGGGTGGIRMAHDVTADEVAVLAREMSHKFAWLNIPRGGAKSGIRIRDPEADPERILFEFGEAIKDLVQSGQYVAGLDLGIGEQEYRQIMRGAGVELPSSDSSQAVDSNYYTALTVFLALRAVVTCDGRPLSGMSVLVEGVGKVGRHLLRLLDRSGAKVVGASTIRGTLFSPGGIDVSRLVELAERLGDDCVAQYADAPLLATRALYRQQADILIPGARVYALDADDVAEMKVDYVVPMANAPATPAAERGMNERGIRFLPGFVSNAGGIFCWYLSRLPSETRESLLEAGFGRRVRELVSEADRTGISIADLARRQARDRARTMQAERSGSFSGRLAGLARRIAPRRLPHLLLANVLGPRWSTRDSIFLRWYFDARYFS